ncbi:MAG TPA: lytic polysaccharide monooxygenase [Streptomyces sp.]|uniref:lytic polysaccharide monooxygenase auxiliary activity family 9 protein n=1 Tax=Streptomyces sp. TaxID=1931 RepID=UPI002D748B55|nr:lytic polysaccharide monooxygenase [Streptomyces sp.]HZG04876.1 lytic polysaccharide monooxygenase [Streptomyces sp.]
MTVRRRAAALAAGAAPLVLTALTAAPAAAHGSMTDPVSRVAACHAEGPESPDSAACKAAVAASGTQAFYDWNEVNIGDAAGRHRQIIPDGKLCSAGRDKYKGLDLPRADWPATPVTAGERTFRYRATAPHRGTFELYITKEGYDPTKPLTWSDLEPEPFAKVTGPTLENGTYVFSGTVPERSGRHLIYSIWQRSDSPEAFYTCSDVTFGGDGGTAPAAPTEKQIAQNAEKSTVSHGGHGGDGHGEHGEHGEQPATVESAGTGGAGDAGAGEAPSSPASAAAAEPDRPAAPAARDGAPAGERPNGDATEEVALARTGGDGGTTAVALGGAAAVLLGGAALLATRRRSLGGRHRA